MEPKSAVRMLLICFFLCVNAQDSRNRRVLANEEEASPQTARNGPRDGCYEEVKLRHIKICIHHENSRWWKHRATESSPERQAANFPYDP